jgi:hypothetical protein
VFLEETPRGRSYSEEYKQKQKKQKEHHRFKTGTVERKNSESRMKARKFEEGEAEEYSVCARC